MVLPLFAGWHLQRNGNQSSRHLALHTNQIPYANPTLLLKIPPKPALHPATGRSAPWRGIIPPMAKKKTQPKKARRKINWQQIIFAMIAAAMILTMVLSMVQ